MRSDHQRSHVAAAHMKRPRSRAPNRPAICTATSVGLNSPQTTMRTRAREHHFLSLGFMRDLYFRLA